MLYSVLYIFRHMKDTNVKMTDWKFRNFSKCIKICAEIWVKTLFPMGEIMGVKNKSSPLQKGCF